MVYLAYHLRLEKKVVIKLVGRDDKMPDRNEVDILKNLHHPNIPQVYNFIQMGNYVYTVMDYIEGTDLAHYLKAKTVFSAENLIRWYKQLSDVLVYLHGQKIPIIHSDIKPENIIIDSQNNAVLIDFNVSLSERPDLVMGLSLDYASPEQIALAQEQRKGIIGGMVLDGRTDIYSLGATFYCLMCYRKASVFFANVPLTEQNTGYPEVFCEIVNRCLKYDREKRYQTAAQLKKALDSMWKRERGYKLYLAAHALTVVMTAGLISAGVFLTVRGSIEKERIAYTSVYNECIQLINTREYYAAENACYQLINQYNNFLNDDLQQEATIYRGLGDIMYARELYVSAAEYYLNAAETDSLEESFRVDCYCAAALSYMGAGQNEMARYVMYQAEGQGITGDSLRLLKMQLMGMMGETESCILAAEELMDSCNDTDILYRVCLAAAEAEQDEKEKLNWYRWAASYAGILNPDGLRQAGYGMLEIAVSSSSSDIAAEALEEAVNCYSTLTSQNYPLENDYMNLVTALRLSKKYDDAIAALEKMESSKTVEIDAGILYLQKAFVYADQGDGIRAMEYCRKASEILSEADVSAEDWQHFRQLISEYGL